MRSLSPPPANTPEKRRLFAAAIGAASALYVLCYARANPGFVSDFDQVWAAAAALWRGENPYLVVGPRGAFHWHWPLYYPMPALVLAAPLALLPLVAARMAFAGISAALLAYGITRDGFSRWPLFISISFIVNVELVQWSNLLTAAMLLPLLSGIAIAKPNIGIGVVAFAERRSTLWVAFFVSTFLLGVSFAVFPSWLPYWLENTRSAPHIAPLLFRPGGSLILTSLLRWRRPEARLLAALACTPLTPTFYDPVLLYVVTRTFREALVLTASTFILFFIVAFAGPIHTSAQWGEIVTTASVWVVYLPCVIIVLRRPNSAPGTPTVTT